MTLFNTLRAGRLEPINIIIYVNAIFYLVSLILYPSALGMMANPFDLLSPANESLLILGASGTIPVLAFDRWWSFLTASFLHGSLLHILFNMIALKHLGPFVQLEYGQFRFIIIYILTGALGFFVSFLAGVAFTIGASASICGLIGAILYYGKSRGDFYGHLIYKQALGWVLGLLVIGFLIPGINNWAHGGGLLAGLGLAWLLGYQDGGARTMTHMIAAWVCITVTGTTLFWSMAQALYIFLFLT